MITIGAWVRYRLYDDRPRLRIGRDSSRRRRPARPPRLPRSPGRPVARAARRHAIDGPSARSTQNRWWSVQTDPANEIVETTGAAAASASHPHGHDLRAVLAPTMPAV